MGDALIGVAWGSKPRGMCLRKRRKRCEDSQASVIKILDFGRCYKILAAKTPTSQIRFLDLCFDFFPLDWTLGGLCYTLLGFETAFWRSRSITNSVHSSDNESHDLQIAGTFSRKRNHKKPLFPIRAQAETVKD